VVTDGGPAPIAGVVISIATACGERTRNEDAVGVDGWVVVGERTEPLRMERSLVADAALRIAVVDGMGGAPDGDRAAVLSARLLTDADASTTMSVLFDRVDRLLRADDSGRGATAAVVHLDATGTATLANIGDVRIYRMQDGFAGQLSDDHRVPGSRSVLSRCLGGATANGAEPAVRMVRLVGGDRLVLCTDGVHDGLSSVGVAQAADAGDGTVAAARVVTAAVAAGDGDNATVVVLDLVAASQAGQPDAAMPTEAAKSGPVASARPTRRRLFGRKHT
jgi:serine/threonine protein phosphatase PrpC